MPLKLQMILDALNKLKRPARVSEIYDEIKITFPEESLGKTPIRTIEARLQEFCPESKAFLERNKYLFRRTKPIEGKDDTFWELLEWNLSASEQNQLKNDLFVDLQNINDNQTIKDTERKAQIQARIGQGEFRNQLLEHWNNACAVTEIKIPQLLRASHIKPWKDSNNEERLDPNNGLLLIANLDAAFDKYLMSFEDDGTMIFSQTLGKDPYLTLGLSQGKVTKPNFTQQQKNYLVLHRNIFYRA
ncbi:HNH endonuclease [Entomobacter blattae]|uniref:HNH nuclease domain-containing protein n=1 Tax=Entomobacter blattae TaxID=2762277 RepID=A0A7H1NUK5_9PROT|nr:HNH endonuclease [Entomobacter blattae]QNT79465.1 hypothetical protein JGUZn3_22640 [Entomobacter blattae]